MDFGWHSYRREFASSEGENCFMLGYHLMLRKYICSQCNVDYIYHPFHSTSLHFIFVTRHRRRGTIEMTLIHLCVHLSFHPSILPSVLQSVQSCPPNSSYFFHWTDLKFYRLLSYHMKMCMWFLIFVSAIFDKVMALADTYLVLPAAPATSFIELT